MRPIYQNTRRHIAEGQCGGRTKNSRNQFGTSVFMKPPETRHERSVCLFCLYLRKPAVKEGRKINSRRFRKPLKILPYWRCYVGGRLLLSMRTTQIAGSAVRQLVRVTLLDFVGFDWRIWR